MISMNGTLELACSVVEGDPRRLARPTVEAGETTSEGAAGADQREILNGQQRIQP